ncbi:MAG: FoF1 ATP synthase subunit gamma [Candidatus Omnitrophota bacterium]
MQLLSKIKADLDFNQNLAELVEVLKQIAISQYHTMEKKIKLYDKIFVVLESLFDMVPAQGAGMNHPLVNLSNRAPGVIAVTSDTGLLGALNMQVMTAALHDVEENNARLIIVGEKGKVYAQENNVPFTSFEGIKDEQRFAQAIQLRNYIVDQEFSGQIGALKIFYPYASSLMSQHIQKLQLLPFAKPKKEKPQGSFEVIMESSLGDAVGYMVYLFLGQKLYEIFGLSRLAEIAARFIHLEDSGHKLEQLEKELRLQYFRQRHELVDRSMRELFAARSVFIK